MTGSRRGIRAAAIRHADRTVGAGSTTEWLSAYTAEFTRLVEAKVRRNRAARRAER